MDLAADLLAPVARRVGGERELRVGLGGLSGLAGGARRGRMRLGHGDTSQRYGHCGHGRPGRNGSATVLMTAVAEAVVKDRRREKRRWRKSKSCKVLPL